MKAETNMDRNDPPIQSIVGENDDELESWDGQSNDEGKSESRPRKSLTVSFGELDSDHELGERNMPPPPADIPDVVFSPGRLFSMVFGCAKWSKARFRRTVFGCLSSIAVLTIRLILDIEPTAYLIHSIVVFLDMVLIHLFTSSVWLSLSGELVTIAMFLAFHFTKQTLWELLETTLLAILCSFHLINSRNKHMDHEKELERDLHSLCRHTSNLLSHQSSGSEDGRWGLTRQQSSRHLMRMRSMLVNWNSDRTIDMDPSDNDHINDLERESPHAKKVKVWGEQFFEHFLDGSAGVMYTSFFGLILDEFIRYGEENKSY